MIILKHKMYLTMTIFVLLQALVTMSVSGHCSSSTLTSPSLPSMLSRSDMLVKASVDKVRADHSATIRILEVFKGKHRNCEVHVHV